MPEPIEVRPVSFPRDIKRFVRCWWPIYKGDPAWVPPIWLEIRRFMDPRRNPFFEVADVQPFIAYRGGKPVGTIAASWDHLQQKAEPGVGFFGFFEFIDDRDVAAALLDAAARWLREEHGARVMRGPANFTPHHTLLGLRVAPFDSRPPTIGNPHNPPYYPRTYEDLGMRVGRELYAYWIEAGPIPPLAERVEQLLLRDGRVQIRQGNRHRFDEDAELLWQLYTDAFEPNWDYSPLTRAEFLFQSKMMKQILDPRLVLLAFVDGEFAAGSITLPDFNQVAIHMNGRLLPWGWTHVVRRRRHITRLRAIIVGVRKKFQHLPLGVPLYVQTWRTALDMGVEGAEVSVILEDNREMRGALEKLGGRIHMTYRIYEKSI
jgi:hypothetical protein